MIHAPPLEAGGRRIPVLTAVTTVAPAFWQEARQACARALGQGLAFVAVLHAGSGIADARLLDEEDRRRAARFRRDIDRSNLILGRNLVHHLVRPGDAAAPCTLSLGTRGRPFIDGRPAFNLSHSEAWIACAVSRNPGVGVDVETFERLGDYRELLATVAHPEEHRTLSGAPRDQQERLFRRCWTRKEAVLKATGIGLIDDLDSLDMRLTESEPIVSFGAPLRLVDLLADDERVTISLALDPSIPGVVLLLGQ